MLEISGKHPNSTDEELLQLFHRNGSLDTLGELYSRYMHLVYGVSLKYLGNREDARDIVMQIFEKLIIDLPGQDVRKIRSKKSTDGRMEGYKIEQEFMESEQELHPIDEEDQSVDEALKHCIEQLKTEQKQCIKLFYYEKLCYQEIADKLDMNEKKVKSYLQNGKRNLKICLERTNVN